MEKTLSQLKPGDIVLRGFYGSANEGPKTVTQVQQAKARGYWVVSYTTADAKRGVLVTSGPGTMPVVIRDAEEQKCSCGWLGRLAGRNVCPNCGAPAATLRGWRW